METAPKVETSPKLLTPDNHVLALLDFEGQMAFATHSIDITRLRTNVALVAGAAHIFNVPAVISTVAAVFDGPVFPEIEEVFPQATTPYYDRTAMSMWEDPALAAAVAKLNKKKVVLAGLWTSVCVVDSALPALAAGYEVYVLADACGDVTPEAHERAMDRLTHAGVSPMTSLQYLLELQHDWAHADTYAAVMTLVKKSGGAYGLGIQYGEQLSKPAAPAAVPA